MDTEQIIQALRQHPNLAEVARATGLGHQHLHKIKRGERKDLRHSTAQKLQHYFQSEAKP